MTDLKNNPVGILCIGVYPAPNHVLQNEYLGFQEANVTNWTLGHSRMIRQTAVEERYTYLSDWKEFYLNKIPGTVERNNHYVGVVLPEILKNLDHFILTNQINPHEIGGVITVSCTGLTNPTLDTKIVSHLALDSCIHWHLGFMGCHGGVVGLHSAAGLCQLITEKIVLVICVEACSLHYQNTLDPEIQISNALFSDGCAFIALRNSQDENLSHLQISQVGTKTFSEATEYLSWNITPSGWLMGLSPRLPNYIKEILKQSAFSSFYRKKNIVVHPGGKAILKAVAEGLELSDLEASYSVLKKFGNMSSATIFFCLQEFLKNERDTSEELTLIAFGPGLDVSWLNLKMSLPVTTKNY